MKRSAAILLIVGLLLAAPAWAAEQVTTVPEPKWPASGRGEFAFVFNGQVGSVGRTEFMTGRGPEDIRVHTAEHDLNARLFTELVIIGGREYERNGADTRWRSRGARGAAETFVPVGNPFAFVSRENATMYTLGDVTVDGVATTQYQIQLDVSKLGDPNVTSAKEDLFIGKNDGYLYRGQVTYRGKDPREVDGESDFILVFRMFDANRPVVIGAPSSHLVDAQSIRSMAGRYEFAGARALPPWAHSLVYHGLVALGRAP